MCALVAWDKPVKFEMGLTLRHRRRAQASLEALTISIMSRMGGPAAANCPSIISPRSEALTMSRHAAVAWLLLVTPTGSLHAG